MEGHIAGACPCRLAACPGGAECNYPLADERAFQNCSSLTKMFLVRPLQNSHRPLGEMSPEGHALGNTTIYLYIVPGNRC